MYDVDNIMSKSRSEMIKFVLVFIAVILMALGIYNYSNQSTEIHTPKPTISEKKKEVKETEKVSVVAQEVNVKKSSAKSLTVKSQKVVSEEPTQEMENDENDDVPGNPDMYTKEGILKKHLPEIPFERKSSYKIPDFIMNNASNLMMTEEEISDMKSQ